MNCFLFSEGKRGKEASNCKTAQESEETAVEKERNWLVNWGFTEGRYQEEDDCVDGILFTFFKKLIIIFSDNQYSNCRIYVVENVESEEKLRC